MVYFISGRTYVTVSVSELDFQLSRLGYIVELVRLAPSMLEVMSVTS